MPANAFDNRSAFGGGGGSGTNTAKTEEDLTGQVDGTETQFIISSAFIASSIDVYYNGIKQRVTSEFTIVNSTTIQTTFTPTATSTLTVAYYT